MKEITMKLTDENSRIVGWLLRRRYKKKTLRLKTLIQAAMWETVKKGAKKVLGEDDFMFRNLGKGGDRNP